jgi:hypothetical protein
LTKNHKKSCPFRQSKISETNFVCFFCSSKNKIMGICLPKGLSRSPVSQVDIDDVFVPPSGPQSLKLFTQVPIVLLGNFLFVFEIIKGLPNSGKSTIIKHWKLLSEKMTKEDILLHKEGVHEFILLLFKTIISIMEKDSRPYEIAENKVFFLFLFFF